MSIYKSAVNKPITTILIFVAIAIFGLFSFLSISLDLFPHIETTNVMVITSYPGASAQDIETNVTKPLENSLNSVDNLKHITSSSKENISVVTLQFEYGTDIEVATANIRDKLDAVTTLPDDVSNPIIFKFSTDDIPIMLMSIKAKESMAGLYKILDDQVSTPLARVSGVGTVSVQGIPDREIQVMCDPYKLEAYGTSIENIATIIAYENRSIPAGSMDVGSNTYTLRVDQEFDEARQLENIIIAHTNGGNVYLRDVATVKDTLQERSQENYSNGEQSGLLIIQKQTGANSVNIAKKVTKKLEEIAPSLPSDVKIEKFIDTSENIVNTANSLKDTILTTLLVVALVVMCTLGRWRATIIVVLTIPISLLSALIYLLVTGDTLNIITMSSLSIAIGMVVDNAIVVLENITTHVDRGERPKQAAIFATKEVGISVIASTLTTIAVFFPLTMISGMAGILFKPMGWMVTITLTVSTLAALTFTPVLCSLMMKQSPKKASFQKYIDKGFGWLTAVYGKALTWAVYHTKTVVISAVALFVVVLGVLGPGVKTEFFSTQDNGRISIEVQLPAGTRQDITRDLALRISEQFQRDYPEITMVSVTEGEADTDNSFAAIQSNGTHIMAFNISLLKKTERKRTLSEIGDQMRKDLDKYTEIRKYKVNESGQRGGASGQSSVDVEVYGYSMEETDKVAQQIKELMLKVEGCSEVSISRDEYKPEVQVVFDRDKLAVNGLNVATAASYLRNRVNGSVASVFREEGEEYDIRVRYDRKFRESVEDVENIIIYNSRGEGVKVRDLGTVIETSTPPTIERKDRSRYVTVSGTVGHGYALSQVLNAAVAEIKQMPMPAGVTWGLGGTYEDQQDTFKEMGSIMVLMVILVFVIMASQFESLTYPFVIMFSLPFALVGVILGLWITGTAMGVMALLGILMLIGIVVNNGIVLVDYTRLCIDRDMPIHEAVITAGKSRLRPILMTTLTTVFGMIPMAVSTNVGSEMWTSLGMSVAWGLSFSTLITLFLIPTLYTIFARTGEKRRHKKARKTEVAA